MILGKWNYKTHKYDDYEVPDDWNVVLYSDDMEEVVNCPHCGKELLYGKTYTSKEIHNSFGLGFGVCEQCYNQEWDRRRKYEEENNEYSN